MKPLYFFFQKQVIFVGLIFLGITACQSQNDEPQIMTVTGPIPASQMGVTLAHEHVLVDWIGADSTGYHRWDREEVVKRVLPFLQQVDSLGIQTFLECTPSFLGRDPHLLEELSQKTGVQILTNTGYYGAVDNKFMPRHAWEESVEELANRWINEYNNGIEDSGIRPGFIKISVKGEGPLSDLHEKIIRAAARTHLATGLTILSHTGGDEPAQEQVEILKEEGVSPSAWVWTHAQSGSLEAQMEIAQQGAWISLDNFNHAEDSGPEDQSSIQWFVNRISELKEAGFMNQILISHDAGYYNPGEPNGGDYRGHTDISEHLVPALRDAGYTEEEVTQLLIGNPKSAIGIKVRKLK